MRAAILAVPLALAAAFACGGRLDTDPIEGPDVLLPPGNECKLQSDEQISGPNTDCETIAAWTCTDGDAQSAYSIDCACTGGVSSCTCTNADGVASTVPFTGCACPDYAKAAPLCGFPAPYP